MSGCTHSITVTHYAFLVISTDQWITNAKIRCRRTGTVYDSGIRLMMSGTDSPFLPWSNVRSNPAKVVLTRAESEMTLATTKSSKPVLFCECGIAFLCLIPRRSKIVQCSRVCSCEMSPNAKNRTEIGTLHSLITM